MNSEVYYRLREQLDQYSFGFPSTESGIELKILEKLFTEEEAEIFLSLTPKLQTPEEVSQRVDRGMEEVETLLEHMTEKGLLFRLRRENISKYGAPAFVAGIFEFQLPKMDHEFAQMMEDYGNEAFHQATAEGAPYFLRPIPINRSIDISHQVAPYEDAREILKNAKSIAVANCICRVQQGLLDKGCDKPMEVCFLFGSNGQYYLDRNMARQVSADEALIILDKAQEAGLVTQPATSQNPAGMCMCCGDCCGILRALNKLPRPVENVFSNYFVDVDKELCTGCEICLDRCQMHAISCSDDAIAQINLDRCIGCGLCVTTCPEEAVNLQSKPVDKRFTPPATPREQWALMAEQRGKTL